jgi:predicted NodU family carbamoyl transferase
MVTATKRLNQRIPASAIALSVSHKRNIFDSLGMLYTAVTEHLGFKVFEEGTVMALAATGDKTCARKFRDLIRFGPDGEFSISKDFISYDTHGLNKPFKRRFIETFGQRRDKGEPITDRHRDLAFALQHTVEETILHVVRALSKRYKSRNLCLTGGVALNCVANGRILRDISLFGCRLARQTQVHLLGVPCGTTIRRSGSHAPSTLGMPFTELVTANPKLRKHSDELAWHMSD